ncbi:hypothetical protein [Streptomyces sp. NPDC048187]|uniref:hypothetical protein n=1 Tax=Streptomyces sp. NPDC048187 TaxID=3365509 RepID=UPI0037226C2E
MSDAVPEPEPRPGPEEARHGAHPDPGYEPAAPAPLEVPRTPTGNAEVDARLARLADADHLATDGHVEVYEDVHRGLRDALTALDARPGPPAPPPPPSPYDRRS